MKKQKKQYELVVIGGGISGVCAALAAARHGICTALLQNRPVLGGNASSEIRVNINGAARHAEKGRENLLETGIMREIELEVKSVNPEHSFSILDTVLWRKCSSQPNLDLYLNTQFTSCRTEDNKIISVSAIQLTTETEYEFIAQLFVDTTGDAVLAYESGADWTIGREAKSQYQEEHAPEKANPYTMGTTIMFTTKDVGHEVEYVKPDWAYSFDEEMLKNRKINMLNHGYWWVEVGGDDELAVIDDAEKIRDELYKWAFGVFDYIKNSGKYEAKNLALDWICSVPGRRESRRILGDYVLNENDVYEGRRFEDAIAYGGWSMDDHSIGGIRSKAVDQGGTIWHQLKSEIYTIPYRSIYSRNIQNLYVGGRAISASHMAMTSTRVIATCGVIGQAIGTAAYFAVRKQLSPKEVGIHYIHELQQELKRDDCYIPGIATNDALDCAKEAILTCSGQKPGNEVIKLINGLDRNEKDEQNLWISNPLGEGEVYVNLHFDKPRQIKQLRLKFDPNLSRPMNTTLVLKTIERQTRSLPPELVRDYKICCYKGEQLLEEHIIKDNKDRLKIHNMNSQNADITDIRITIERTYGEEEARIFEVRAYESCENII